jgi:hypothetical protein
LGEHHDVSFVSTRRWWTEKFQFGNTTNLLNP